jgi:phage minor structural protein
VIVYFADRQLNVLGQASTALPEGLIISDDNKTDEIETGVSVFECKIAYTEETQAKVKAFTAPGNYLLRNHGNESNLYSIVEREIDTKKQEVYIYAEDDGMDLLNEVVGEYEADKAYNIKHYIDMYAADAGFQIGINEAASLTRKLAWDGESTATARIASVATQFDGCEVSYSFQVDGLRVVKKIINIYKERGKDTGLQLRLNRDIDSIITKESITNLATALQCTGGTPEGADNPITLKGYKYDDGDFYVDNGILKSREALKKWARLLWKTDTASKSGGHITKLFSYETESQATLCTHAITELKKYRDMEVNYETEIPNFPDEVRVGDRVNIIDDSDELYVSARVLQLETSVTNEENKVVLGEHLIKTSGIHQKVADLAAQFAKNALSAARALALANSAKADAQNAQTKADSALEGAQNAQQVAEAAQNAANTANESASLAQEKADAAQSAVDKVEESVESLETTIVNAQKAADQAQQAADTAEIKATEAQQAAINAQAKAEETETALAETNEKAESAIAQAEVAKTTAEQAIADAEVAATTATAAKLDAENAQKNIDSLGDRVTTLSNTMSVDYARKTDLTEATASLQTQITQNAAEISSTASRVQTIDETANNAQEQAEAAQTKADEAQAKADQAATDAQAAQSAANEATAAANAAQSEANTAKAAAATAQSVVEKAEADLEVAKADLATVSGRVDATEEDIEKAQLAVEAAQSAADKAKEDAEAAAKKAVDAQTTADTAVTNAATAQQAANEAADLATIAQATADVAKGDAAAAQTTANEAKEAANAAQATANTAKTNAEAAQAKADQAAADAATAQQAADDADAKAAQAASDLATAKQNLADVTSRVDATEEEVEAAQAAVVTAQAAADKAKADAATAQSTADTAKANAATAQAAADNAQAVADKAQEDATAAQQAADKAQADVDNLAVRVTTAETKITQNTEQIELRAKKTEVAKTLGGYYTKAEADAAITTKANEINLSVDSKIEGVQVGGRNLLLDSETEKTREPGGTQVEFLQYADIAPIIKEHGFIEYTISFDIKSADVSQSNSIAIYCQNGNGTLHSIGYNYITVTTDYERHHITVTPVIQNEEETQSYLAFYGTYGTGNIPFVKNVKIEKGNKATDWTPAPEDMASASDVAAINEEIASVMESMSTLDVKANNITASVKEIETKTDNAINSVNGSIETLAKEVSSKMTKEAVSLEIQTVLENGTSKVVTKTGFALDEDGLTVEKSGNEMKTQITENGMTVYQNDEEVLTANNKGVDAKNLHATTYLIVGGRSRFENYGNDRTGCFWIGG